MIFISLNCCAILHSNYSNHSSTNKTRSYKVFDAQHEQVGIIMGSIHLGLNQESLKPSMEIIHQYLDQVKNVYFETKIYDTSGTVVGLETAITDSLNQRHQENKIIELETINEQFDMIYDIYLIGPYAYSLPLQNLRSITPVGATIIRSINSIILLPINLIYQNIINPNFLANLQKKNSDTIEMLKQNFVENKTGPLSSQDTINYRLTERDIKIFKRFKQHQEQSPGTFIFITGSLHLANDNGILSIFEQAGYNLEPIELS